MYEYRDCDLLFLMPLVKMTLYNFANITKLWGERNKINLLSLVGKSHVTMNELINQSI